MSKLIDLTGQKFGRLTVIEYAGKNKYNHSLVKCSCDCGNEKTLEQYSLISGKTKSCGCLQKEKTIQSLKKYNEYDLTGEFGVGYTGKGEEFYFDVEDYNKIKDYYWAKQRDGYIVVRLNKDANKISTISMHRLITSSPIDMCVDHINHNKSDNRKCNLRLVNYSQNGMNSLKAKNNTSGVTGVSWKRKAQLWYATLMIDGKTISKSFISKRDAIDYRKYLEQKYFGEYALKEELLNE